MDGPDHLIVIGSLFAYGPAPGVELIPYFLGLLAWLGLAVVAVVWAPIASVLRRVRGTRNPPTAAASTPAVARSGLGEPPSPPTPRPPPTSD